MHAAVEELRALFAEAEGADYIGEAVTQLAHALQAAYLASRAGADDEDVLGALLHDVGHLCAPAGSTRMGADGVARHEDVGASYLASLGFAPSVCERVRGHVAAKRYLVSTRPDYGRRLSAASRRTLEHQGGPMGADERAAFEASPLAAAWLRLRSWDEAAKEPALEVPGFDAYVPRLEAHLRTAAAPRR